MLRKYSWLFLFILLMGCNDEERITAQSWTTPDPIMITDNNSQIYAKVNEELQICILQIYSETGEKFGVEFGPTWFYEWNDRDDLYIEWASGEPNYYINGILVSSNNFLSKASSLSLSEDTLGLEMMEALYSRANIDPYDPDLKFELGKPSGGEYNPCGYWSGVASGVARYKCMFGGLSNPVCIAANGIVLACLIAVIGCWAAGGC